MPYFFQNFQNVGGLLKNLFQNLKLEITFFGFLCKFFHSIEFQDEGGVEFQINFPPYFKSVTLKQRKTELKDFALRQCRQDSRVNPLSGKIELIFFKVLPSPTISSCFKQKRDTAYDCLK